MKSYHVFDEKQKPFQIEPKTRRHAIDLLQEARAGRYKIDAQQALRRHAEASERLNQQQRRTAERRAA
jgi:hypothetical protein